MYCTENFPTKKALKQALADGRKLTIFQPGGMFPTPTNGTVALEGPHYPKPHKWYAQALIKDGLIVSVK